MPGEGETSEEGVPNHMASAKGFENQHFRIEGDTNHSQHLHEKFAMIIFEVAKLIDQFISALVWFLPQTDRIHIETEVFAFDTSLHYSWVDY